ncbi:MAG TPA: CHRD domain-containing protein [Rhizomicrobium sp.]|nr:CHRD domain-containing protein [Rhizomicrobium sp.]
MVLKLLRRFAAAAMAAGLLYCSPAFAADTYQANLGPMPLDAANRSNMLGRGDATAALQGKTLTVTGQFAGLPSPATAAHIIVGLAIGVPGTEALDLTVSQASSGSVSGTLTLTAKQAAAFRTGRLYVQIDSQKAPSGNLWGWLLPQHEDAAADVPQQGPWFLPQLNTPTR